MLTKLKLYGDFADFVGYKEFDVKIHSVRQAVSFLINNFPKLSLGFLLLLILILPKNRPQGVAWGENGWTNAERKEESEIVFACYWNPTSGKT